MFIRSWNELRCTRHVRIKGSVNRKNAWYPSSTTPQPRHVWKAPPTDRGTAANTTLINTCKSPPVLPSCPSCAGNRNLNLDKEFALAELEHVLHAVNHEHIAGEDQITYTLLKINGKRQAIFVGRNNTNWRNLTPGSLQVLHSLRNGAAGPDSESTARASHFL